jgi:hypothetical protein
MGSTSALDAVHGLSTGAKYIAKNGMDLILLLMASRWVQDGFNIGFGRRSQDGLKIVVVRIGPSPRLSEIKEQIVL